MAIVRSPASRPAVSILNPSLATAAPSAAAPLSPSPAEPSSGVVDRVSAAFQQLTESASVLNKVSDELAKPIAAVEGALKKLNLGVPSWVQLAGETDHGTGEFWDRSLGYAKVGGQWGIALRAISGNIFDPDEPRGDYWLFSDAPRTYRLEAVDKLPELLEGLVVTANATAEELRKKIDGARQVAHTVATVASANAGTKK